MNNVIWAFILMFSFATTAVAASMSERQKHEQLEEIKVRIKAHYVLESALPHINEGLDEFARSKGFEQIKDKRTFSEALTQQLHAYDKHFSVRWNDPDVDEARESGKEPWPEKIARQNYGFAAVENLKGNVGYINLHAFAELTATTRALADAAVTLVKDSDVIIIDLRENGGGSPDMVRFLSSFLLEARTHLNSFYDRESDNMTEFWTMDDVPSWLANTPLYILTSQNTFSAAEEFAYNLKHLKRATLIGEVTRGGANPWRYFTTSDNFEVGIPTAMAVNPITKTNWEGKGVIPHIVVSASNAKTRAYEEALIWLSSRVNHYAKDEIEMTLSQLTKRAHAQPN
ncbi:S41 family peptidase [Alteromonas sp. H39]|uniref:S41 family peptidase n=1 Tax=Alteromonas sp. H39 TaxID=3389876 RepID=UPI0039E027D8